MPASVFPTTRDSVVAALGSEDSAERRRAFDTITRIYRTPLITYARIAHRRSPDDAEELAQSFLAVAFERESLARYDARKASFRTFLRTLFDRFSSNDARAAARQKRGGDRTRVELTDESGARDPEELFRREWIRSVFSVAVERLRSSIDADAFAMFEQYDLQSGVSYRDLGERFGVPETTVTNRLAAARRQFRQTVLGLLREITASDAEFRSEARTLLGGSVDS